MECVTVRSAALSSCIMWVSCRCHTKLLWVFLFVYARLLFTYRMKFRFWVLGTVLVEMFLQINHYYRCFHFSSVYVFSWLDLLFCIAFVPKIKRQVVKFPQKRTPALLLQTTALDHALPRWITRCVKASSLALCARRLCAAPQWDGRGVTPVRCAQPSLIPAEEGSYQTTARGLAKVKSVPSESLFLFLSLFSHVSVTVPPFSFFEWSAASIFLARF